MFRNSAIAVVWLIVGVIVAANKDYFDNLNTAEQVVSSILAVLLWPLLFLGVDLHVNF